MKPRTIIILVVAVVLLFATIKTIGVTKVEGKVVEIGEGRMWIPESFAEEERTRDDTGYHYSEVD